MSANKTLEPVAWILRADTGNVRLWTQDRGFAEQKAGDWETECEPLCGLAAAVAAIEERDARIVELEGLVADADSAMADAMVLIAHPDETKWRPARERFRAYRARVLVAIKGEPK